MWTSNATYHLETDTTMQKTILITGSTDGIGLETARMLVEQGHQVLLHGRNAAKLADVDPDQFLLHLQRKDRDRILPGRRRNWVTSFSLFFDSHHLMIFVNIVYRKYHQLNYQNVTNINK